MLMFHIMIFPLTLLCLLEVEGSQYLGQQHSPIPSSAGYYNAAGSGKGQLSINARRNYGSAPGFWHTNAAGGSITHYNIPSASGAAAMYYKNQRADKSVYDTAHAGRFAGKPLAGGGHYSRFINEVQDPLRSRYGHFNLPLNTPNNQGAYSGYSGYRTAGFYGGRTPSVYSYPVNNVQAFRGSRIYDGSKAVHQTSYSPTSKNTGVYVIPTPSKLYYDGVKN